LDSPAAGADSKVTLQSQHASAENIELDRSLRKESGLEADELQSFAYIFLNEYFDVGNLTQFVLFAVQGQFKCKGDMPLGNLRGLGGRGCLEGAQQLRSCPAQNRLITNVISRAYPA
jgi:hypothetical protein